MLSFTLTEKTRPPRVELFVVLEIGIKHLLNEGQDSVYIGIGRMFKTTTPTGSEFPRKKIRP